MIVQLCFCGCGLPAQYAARSDRRRGHVKDRPMPLRLGHKAMSADRWSVEDRGYETPCFVWKGRVDHGGYAMVHVHGTNRTSIGHRHYYVQQFGPVPDGLVLDHLCRVRSCVNPEHLEPVTQLENVRRGLNGVLKVAA